MKKTFIALFLQFVGDKGKGIETFNFIETKEK